MRATYEARPRAVLTARSRVGWRDERGSAMRPVRWISTMPNGFTRSQNASSLSGSPATMIVSASKPTSTILASKIAVSSVT